MKTIPFFLALIWLLMVTCGKKNVPQEPQPTGTGPSANPVQYRNPVFEPILADPSIIKGTDGWYYGYGTEDDWGDGKGNRLVPVVRSLDLVRWSLVGNAFTAKPVWKAEGGLWAVDVVRVNNLYHMYYSFSLWADRNPAIGLAVANSPAGPFVDKGKLFFSEEIGVPVSIDPHYYEENGKKYLFFGSYSSQTVQGTYAVELTADGYAVKDINQKTNIAAGDFEAVMIHKRGNYYYFFGSKGSCCDGAASTYNVRVARSENLLGPYLDQAGKNIVQRGNGTLILQGNSKFAGPGHNAKIITDKNGTDWLFYHAIDKMNPKVSSGASRRMLMLDKLSWVEGWPVIANGVPSGDIQAGPEL
ncbi:family 43 glycosylhydrolase [Pedobacter heparinus]|uniref:Glycoside hydrolase family 43 n=1 Tax=Pedobacter heparinus (strain ATCC 13125 / DSM 2366 / CIP 104194 / JCM 7457 / NBRC 12017 / NCIMB 9290 / NRRL B-14731 / HIM 762-3) TaxID=485917 RepID=C6XSN4_PEDHD|nr:family 43 glycosylhydrolase [Pedobacter heparinus]ACU05597.1 glycoside hydrolase family 43 [Pedobacter heparinus DSM 2366]